MTVALTISLWSASVLYAAYSGVFARMTPAVFDALAIFAIVFSIATYYLDEGVRKWVRSLKRATLRDTAIILDAILAAGVISLAHSGGEWIAHLADWPYAPLPLLFVPLALAVHVAQLDRAFKSPEGKSPAATPAAT